MQKASISRCKFFSLQGELKRRWGLLFCLSPSDEFMHLKRSFVTRELALCACTLSALPDGLYIIWGWERNGKRADFMLREGKCKKKKERKKRHEEKGILSMTCMHVHRGIKRIICILINHCSTSTNTYLMRDLSTYFSLIYSISIRLVVFNRIAILGGLRVPGRQHLDWI